MPASLESDSVILNSASICFIVRFLFELQVGQQMQHAGGRHAVHTRIEVLSGKRHRGGVYNPKSEKVVTVWKMQIKKVVISKFTLTCISLQTI